MKRSNKLMISVVLLSISWLLLNGWLHANAYKRIVSGKSCSYAWLSLSDNIKQVHSFKNIKIDFEKKSSSPKLVIQYSKKQELSCSNNLKKAISYNVSGDTLYLRINYLKRNIDDYFNISVPLLKSVNISSASDIIRVDSPLQTNYSITISGFTANTLTINNNCQFGLLLAKNKLNKLEMKGDFKDNGNVEIQPYSDCDSLDIDFKGKNGTLFFSNPDNKVNPKQWISIKVPRIFRIEADATVSSKVIIKK